MHGSIRLFGQLLFATAVDEWRFERSLRTVVPAWTSCLLLDGTEAFFFFFERNQERSKANNIYFSKLRGIYFVQRLVTFSAVGALRANYYAFRVDKHQG
jgi:hypothetical protein